VTVSDEQEQAMVMLVDDAVEILVERRSDGLAVAVVNRLRVELRSTYDRQAFELLAADVEHHGRVTVTPRMLAELLAPRPVAPVVALAEPQPRNDGKRPAGWLDPGTFQRCLNEARQALTDRGGR
jgi:hypothetical protein